MQFRSTAILIAGVISFNAQNVSFGILVASTLAPWGTIERSRGTSEHKKISRSHFPALLALFRTTDVLFLVCVFTGHIFLRFRGLPLDVWRSRIKHSVSAVLQKTTFHICWDSVDFDVIFTYFRYGFGSNFDDFWCFGDRLDIC